MKRREQVGINLLKLAVFNCGGWSVKRKGNEYQNSSWFMNTPKRISLPTIHVAVSNFRTKGKEPNGCNS